MLNCVICVHLIDTRECIHVYSYMQITPIAVFLPNFSYKLDIQKHWDPASVSIQKPIFLWCLINSTLRTTNRFSFKKIKDIPANNDSRCLKVSVHMYRAMDKALGNHLEKEDLSPLYHWIAAVSRMLSTHSAPGSLHKKWRWRQTGHLSKVIIWNLLK